MKWESEAYDASLKEIVDFGLDNCIGANECMRVCPVNRLDIDQRELDSVLVSGQWTERVQAFVEECIQCGDCTLACPAAVQRDHMVLALKSMLPKRPREWKYYSLLKGRQDRFWFLDLYDIVARVLNGRLGQYIDKPQLDQKDLLFYFGCYVFSPSHAPEATLKLADRIGLDYEVLAGLKSCCGWPQYLTGETGYGQTMLDYLGKLIEQANPKTIVTGCAECYVALLRLKKLTGGDWEALTTPMWLLRHADALNWRKFSDPIGIHDSCHVSKKVGKPNPARELLDLMADRVELYETPEDCLCCAYYNIHTNDELNERLHQQKLQDLAKSGGKAMAVECVTCWESFDKPFKEADVPLWEMMVAAEVATRPESEA
jgi:Fe-S oxidoreductase